MTYTYTFCNIPFEISAPRAIREDAQTALFRSAGGDSPISITLDALPALPTPQLPLLGTRGERSFWSDGVTVTRLTRDPFRREPHLSVTYRLDDPSRVHLTAREECWPWATASSFLWPGAALPQLLLHRRALVFHASCIEHDGGAIFFTAPSQTGKSTQAELWRVHRGAHVRNGDKAALRLDGQPTAYGMPFSGTSGICEPFALPPRCIVVLSQAPENSIRRLGATEALRELSPNVFSDRLVSAEWSLTLSLLLELVAKIPVYHLACTPDIRAVEALENALKELV